MLSQVFGFFSSSSSSSFFSSFVLALIFSLAVGASGEERYCVGTFLDKYTNKQHKKVKALFPLSFLFSLSLAHEVSCLFFFLSV